MTVRSRRESTIEIFDDYDNKQTFAKYSGRNFEGFHEKFELNPKADLRKQWEPKTFQSKKLQHLTRQVRGQKRCQKEVGESEEQTKSCEQDHEKSASVVIRNCAQNYSKLKVSSGDSWNFATVSQLQFAISICQ